MNFRELLYTVEGHKNLSHDTAMRIWKTTYADFAEFHRNVIKFDHMNDFRKHCAEIWEEIVPATVKEAFAEPNLEIRRLLFKAIGVAKIFAELDPVLIDKHTLTIENLRWDEKNVARIEHVEDTYELYRIDGKKLFPEEKSEWKTSRANIYAVRCWCTTTGREYWIYVPREVGEKNDAIEAIAWTLQINISNPEKIYRQGDIIISKAGPESQVLLRPQSLTKDQYLTLLVSQT